MPMKAADIPDAAILALCTEDQIGERIGQDRWTIRDAQSRSFRKRLSWQNYVRWLRSAG